MSGSPTPGPTVEPSGPRGPLRGIRVLELASIGPIPFCGMVLSDMGADVIRLDRMAGAALPQQVLDRGRRSIAVDLKQRDGLAVVLDLVASSDVLIEGYRPGVAERLGVGPEACLARNARLVYGRMTGWGRSGPLADRAGHDINYLAVAGALGAFGRAGEPPVPPLSIIADLGAGGLLLAYGITCALFERATSGSGQVVDAAMLDGTALFMGPWLEAQQAGTWNDARGTNNLDSGAPYYDSYRCADGEYVAVGALEPQFYARLLDGLELDAAGVPDRNDRANWSALRTLFAERFSKRTRNEWADHFEGVDACVAPVLKLAEVPRHPQIAAGATIVSVDGVVHPAPAPRLDRTPGAIAGRVSQPGADTDEVLAELGYDEQTAASLRARGVVT
jgi:alpha-methylacyl-CoA racemase